MDNSNILVVYPHPADSATVDIHDVFVALGGDALIPVSIDALGLNRVSVGEGTMKTLKINIEYDFQPAPTPTAFSDAD